MKKSLKHYWKRFNRTVIFGFVNMWNCARGKHEIYYVYFIDRTYAKCKWCKYEEIDGPADLTPVNEAENYKL